MKPSALEAVPELGWSFIDLKAWALAAVGDDPVGDPFIGGRRRLDLGPGPVTAGAIRLAPGEGRVDGQPADAFFLALTGRLTLHVSGRRFELEPGDSMAIPPDTAFDWRCSRPTVLASLRHAGAAGHRAAPCRLDPATERSPSGAPLSELLTTPTPQCRNHTQYASADGAFVCGVWDSTPYARTAMTYGHHELMHLLEGAVTLADEAGRVATFDAGDVLLVRRGASSWTSARPVTKVFAIYRPG